MYPTENIILQRASNFFKFENFALLYIGLRPKGSANITVVLTFCFFHMVSIGVRKRTSVVSSQPTQALKK